jgi:hypothetical protein
MTRSRQTADWGSRAGLAKIVPSSVAVGSGTGSASALGTVTYTGVSSVSLNDVFNSTYTNYRIVGEFSSSTDQEVFLRLRASGSDLSTSVYRVGLLQLGVGIASALSATANTSYNSLYLSNNGSAQAAGFVADIVAPNKTQAKFFSSQGTGRLGYWSVAQIQDASAYTGFTILCTGGTTMTGTISVYGYTI